MDIKKKNIWIVSYYTAPPPYDTHLRHRKFAHYLENANYNVTIITGSFIRNKDSDLIPKDSIYLKKVYDGIKYIHIRTMHYKGNGVKRMLAILQFAIRLNILRNKFQKPDIIIHNAHIPFDNLISRCAKKLKAKYIVEVWDLWPESFVAFGLIKKDSPLMKIAYKFEKHLYKIADSIIFTMEGGKDYIIEKKWDKDNGGPVDIKKVFYINNGIDIKDFEKDKIKYQTDDIDLNNKELFKVIYLGSIRSANNVKLLIDAASLLQNYSNIKFLIYGDGSERKKLKTYCSENHISNVVFKEKWIPLTNVPYVVSSSSLNISNYKSNSISKYGGSQGKMFQYMASGKPICSNQVMGYDLIIKYNIGIAKKFNSSQEYADAILSFSTMDKNTYNEICKRAKIAALDFDFKILSKKLIKTIEN